jgi:hypothetical protein
MGWERKEKRDTYISIVDDITFPPSTQDDRLLVLIIIVLFDVFLFFLKSRVGRFAFSFSFLLY